MINLEGTSAFLLPHDPVAKQSLARTIRGIADISVTGTTPTIQHTRVKLVLVAQDYIFATISMMDSRS